MPPIFAFPPKSTIVALINNVTTFLIPVAIDPDDRMAKVNVDILFNDDKTIPFFVKIEGDFLTIEPYYT